MKADAIIFDTDFVATRATIDVKDGFIRFQGKEWMADKARPFMVKANAFGKVQPLYLLKWNSIEPLKYKVRSEAGEWKDEDAGDMVQFRRHELVSMSEEDIKTLKHDKYLPEMLRATVDMRFLKNMKLGTGDRDKPDLSGYAIYVIAIVGALLIMAFLNYSGVLPNLLKSFGYG